MNLPIQNKHENHQVKIKLITGNRHYARLDCVECNKWIKWLSREETDAALKLGFAE